MILTDLWGSASTYLPACELQGVPPEGAVPLGAGRFQCAGAEALSDDIRLKAQGVQTQQPETMEKWQPLGLRLTKIPEISGG